MLAHHEGIAAIAAPHANAYKRLQPDMLNGYWANWGFDDRTVCIRIPPARGEGTRIEHRMSDGAANPYLVAAAVLHAARFGVEHQMSPPEPQTPGEPRTPTGACRRPWRPRSRRSRPTTSSARRSVPGSSRRSPSSSAPNGSATRRPVGDATTTEVTPWELDYYLPFF